MTEALLYLTGGIGLLLMLLLFLLLMAASIRWLREQQTPKAKQLIAHPTASNQAVLSSRDTGNNRIAFESLMQHLSDLGTIDPADFPKLEGQLGPKLEGQLGNVKKMLDTRTGQYWLCIQFQAGDQQWTEYHLLSRA